MPVNPRVRAVLRYVMSGCLAATIILALFAMAKSIQAQVSNESEMHRLDTDNAVNSDRILDLKSKVASMDGGQLALATKLNDISLSIAQLRMENEQMKQQSDSIKTGLWTMAASLFGVLAKFAADAWRDRSVRNSGIVVPRP